MRYLLSILILGLISCGPKHRPYEPKEDDRVQVVRSNYVKNLEALKSVSDQETGWPDTHDCDGTLWAGLALAAGADVKLGRAEYQPGEIHRRPTECYPDESASTVSNDMLMGYLWGMWATKNLEALKRLADYGEKNSWKMGTGDLASTVLRPNGYGLLGRIIFSLSRGADVRSYRSLPAVYLPVVADYEKHLMAEGITLNGEVSGGIGDEQLKRLRELADGDPSDELFAAAYAVYSGNYSNALDRLLVDPPYVPTYVRGSDNYKLVYWLKAAKLILDKYPI